MLKVMIIDNEAAIRKGLIHCIRWESLGCTIAAQAEDGIDALEQLPAVQPDIIISDIRMPGMNGLELAREIRAQYPWIKVIILTGFPDFEYAQQAITHQVIDFVLKPTSVESLTHAVEKAKSQITKEKVGQELERELATKEAQNLVLERSILLRDLIRGVEFSQLYLLNRTAQLGMNLTGYYLLRLDISPLTENLQPPSIDGEEQLLLFLHQAQTVLSDCLTSSVIYYIPWGDQKCYAVVQASADYPVYERSMETVSILNSLPQFYLSVGISTYCDSPLRMPQMAEQADKAAQFARNSSEMPVMSVQQIPSIPQQAMDRIFSDLRLLKSAIENQNREGTREILIKLFTYMRQSKLPVDTMRNICVYIHQFCLGLLFLPDTKGYMSENSIPALKRLIESTTTDALEQQMFTFIEQILSRLAEDDAKAGSLIRTIKTYIGQHYAKDLSLDHLSSRVHLSPGYLSRLFKRETGENLSSYVQNARIEEAKTLLRTTALKTYEVAERVGIPDPVYFSRTFKKLTGIKPKDYRRETE